MAEVPKIEPIRLKEYDTKQSKYNMVPKVPFRSIILGPSGSGKTILLQNMILDIYRGCFSRIYIFSPSVDVDMTWKPVKDYIEKELKLYESDKEKFYFSEYNPEDLFRIIDTQHKVIEYMEKLKGVSKLYSILIIVDDMADNPTVTRQSTLLHQLYTRGRHHCISCITATQTFSCIALIIRVNATDLYVYKLRNYKDMEAFVEEVQAMLPNKKELLDIYRMAASEPYSFLFVNLRAKSINDTFMIRLDKKIEVEDI